MAPKSTPLLFLILSIFFIREIAAAPFGIGSRKIVGGWQDIKDPRDPKVVEIGKFAVAEHNKKSPGLKLVFGSVIKGQYQVVSGINYKLIIGAGGSPPRYYEVVVYDKPWAKVRQLISFKQVP